MAQNYEWDATKAEANLKKHEVSFEEAATVFGDSLSETVPNPDHSEDEERFITIGYSNRHRLLMVAYTQRGDNIRIISARKLTRLERQAYEEEQSN